MNVSAWLKGNIHCHTTFSDGKDTPEQVIAWYSNHGYEFLAITDHNRYLGDDDLRRIAVPEDFTVVRGNELSYLSQVTQRPVHVCDIGASGQNQPERKAILIDGGPPATMEAALSAAAGLPIIAHPCWNWPMNSADLLAVRKPYLLEIWNPSSRCNTVSVPGTESPENMWDVLLSAGRCVWAAVGDDCHSTEHMFGHGIGGGTLAWVRTDATARTEEAIVAAMREGRFYCSTGVELVELATSESEYSLSVRQVDDRKYAVCFIGRHGRILDVVPGNEAQYMVRGDEQYVRARVEDTMGCRCWTQPVMLPPAQRTS